MKKRTLSLLLALVMVIGLLPVTARAGELDNGLLYEVYEDHVEITGYTGEPTEIVIPAEIEGLPVTVIGDGAFTCCGSLTSIDIPNSVTSIGNEAFLSCFSLSSISIPDTVTSIGGRAFYDCSNLSSISIPDGVTAISTSTFNGCSSLTTITIPDSITSIGSYAFAECSSLASFFIPDSVIVIDYFAFLRCSSLTCISIPASVSNIGDLTFSGCSSLIEIVVDDDNPYYSSDIRGVLFDKEKTVLLQAPGAITDSYSIPKSVTKIGFEAFNGCSSLTNISIPDTVTSIGGSAFHDCSNLTSISIPDGVSSIGDDTFSGCSSLTSINIPDTVIEIGYYAFSKCSNLTKITIPDSVTYIGEYAFSECSSLTSVNIPDSVIEIGYYAFSKCSSLTNITIPNSIEYIAGNSFNGCSSLLEIVVDEGNPNYSNDHSGVLFNKEKTKLIRAPEAILGAYLIPDGTTDIDVNAFTNCSRLTRISIPESVTNIGRYACFLDCSSLREIVVDEDNPNYSSDNSGVLFNKKKTELIQAPLAITNFYRIPDTVTKIGSYAFMDCASLTDVSIPDSVAEISSYAFCGCSNLTTISIPDSVTEISNSTFSGCASLTDVFIPDSVTKISAEAFYGCSGLTNIAIPNCVKGIYTSAFSGCSSLTSVTIPDSVLSMGSYAFSDCSSLTSIRFLGDAPEMYDANNIFYGVTATAYYPSNNSTWTKGIMKDCGGAITWIPYTSGCTFDDVKVSSFYYEPVMWALSEGITSGTEEGVFSPYDSCLRSQVVTFLWRAAGEPQAESAVNPFVDVKPSDYYYDAVLWAVEKGITTGADSTHFEPNGVCNRAQVVTFLYRAFEKPPVENAGNPFTDVSAGAWYAAPVLWAVKEGITNGLSATEFGPNEVCNRSQVVTFLYRAYN